MKIEATIPEWALLTWEGQAKQFPKVGKPGIEFHVYCACGRPACRKGTESCGEIPVQTFTYRNNKGHLVGILYRYPTDSELEKAGNVNIWIRPDRKRRGIGTKLVDACIRKFGMPDWEQQRYSQEGAEFAYRMIQRYQP